jgi:transposase
MFFLGIDIGKNKHVASVLKDDGKSVLKAFSFTNTTEGGKSLIAKLESIGANSDNLIVGLEATGHYWLSLFSFLRDKGFHQHVINPIQTDGWRKGVEIRKHKTDKIDSVLIADLIRYGNFIETNLPDESILSLKNLTRFRTYLVDSISDLKRKIICVLDQVFPEYQKIFSDVFGTTSKEILVKYSSPAELENLSVNALARLLSKLSRKQLGAEKATELSKSAKSSFGVKFCRDSFSFQLRLMLKQIKYVESQIKETETEINKIMGKVSSQITTIPGIGKILGAVILGEIGDINKFDNQRKLVAFAGIDATVKQSGEFESTNNKMSKRGSSYLRRALYQASLVACVGKKPDPILSKFYRKKIAEGKHHNVVIGAVMRKMCNIIYSVLTNDRPYEVRE